MAALFGSPRSTPPQKAHQLRSPASLTAGPSLHGEKVEGAEAGFSGWGRGIRCLHLLHVEPSPIADGLHPSPIAFNKAVP